MTEPIETPDGEQDKPTRKRRAAKPAERVELYTLLAPSGEEVTIRRNVDTGVSEVVTDG